MDKWFRLYKAAVAYNVFQRSFSAVGCLGKAIYIIKTSSRQIRIIKNNREWMLDFGSLTDQNKYGMTILHFVYDNPLAIKWLLINVTSIDVNAQDNVGMTALHLASLGYKESVRYLLEYENIDVHIKANNGYPALYYAHLGGNWDIAKILSSINIDHNTS